MSHSAFERDMEKMDLLGEQGVEYGVAGILACRPVGQKKPVLPQCWTEVFFFKQIGCGALEITFNRQCL